MVDQRWIDTGAGTAVDRFQYGYDRDGNRTYRDNRVSTGFGEVYTYDGLNQLASFDRGTLNGTKDGITGTVARSQDWDYDALGNWESLATDGGSPVARTHNRQNEVTAVGAASLAFDANGNLTTDETGRTLVYDAWNRLVTVKSGATTLVSYAYDGLGRRVSETASSVTTDLYYSSQWQVLEERVGGAATARYVWSPVYVDAVAVRDRDTDANGSLDERLWPQQDANWNVTALVDGTGAVVERYAYDPFGAVTIYTPTYSSVLTSSGYAWTHYFQGFQQDEVTGLLEADRRWYSPTLGRWITLDPILFQGGDNNLYRSVANNPHGLTDPEGLELPHGDNWPGKPTDEERNIERWAKKRDKMLAELRKIAEECFKLIADCTPYCAWKYMEDFNNLVRLVQSVPYRKIQSCHQCQQDIFMNYVAKAHRYPGCSAIVSINIKPVFWEHFVVGIPFSDQRLGHAALMITFGCETQRTWHIDDGWWGHVFTNRDIPWHYDEYNP